MLPGTETTAPRADGHIVHARPDPGLSRGVFAVPSLLVLALGVLIVAGLVANAAVRIRKERRR